MNYCSSQLLFVTRLLTVVIYRSIDVTVEDMVVDHLSEMRCALRRSFAIANMQMYSQEKN